MVYQIVACKHHLTKHFYSLLLRITEVNRKESLSLALQFNPISLC